MYLPNVGARLKFVDLFQVGAGARIVTSFLEAGIIANRCSNHVSRVIVLKRQYVPVGAWPRNVDSPLFYLSLGSKVESSFLAWLLRVITIF